MREHFIDIAVCYLATNVQNISAVVLNSSNLSCNHDSEIPVPSSYQSVHPCCLVHQIAIAVRYLTRQKKGHLAMERVTPCDYLKTCFSDACLHIYSQWWEPIFSDVAIFCLVVIHI